MISLLAKVTDSVTVEDVTAKLAGMERSVSSHVLAHYRWRRVPGSAKGTLTCRVLEGVSEATLFWPVLEKKSEAILDWSPPPSRVNDTFFFQL